jgi:hypothetical protein
MQRADFKCEECGNDEVTLHVHHTYYEKNHTPWEYPDESLQCLCENCHQTITNTQNLLNEQLRKLRGRSDCLQRLLGYALGIESEIDPDMPIEVFSIEVAVGLAHFWFIPEYEVLHALRDDIIDGHKLAELYSRRHRHQLRQAVIDVFQGTPPLTVQDEDEPE